MPAVLRGFASGRAAPATRGRKQAVVIRPDIRERFQKVYARAIERVDREMDILLAPSRSPLGSKRETL